MKKLVFGLFVISSFTMVSCSSDDFLNSENDVNFT